MAHDLFRTWKLGTTLAAGLGAAAAAAIGAPTPAAACGGLYCSAANPVNQAAEKIIFSDNGDGTVTAVIQIMYEGPSHDFAWVLPIPGNPDVGVSSTQALDTLQAATNPLYQLNTVLDEDCNFGFPRGGFSGAGGAAAPTAPSAGGDSEGPGGVSVLASGAVGPYDYTTIAVDPTLSDPADVALEWLMANGYEVTSIAPDVLRPYLEDDLNLIAFKLSSSSDSGSIRPVMITYDATRPSIPIRPTAVAANDDMGVMVWLLSDARGIPDNYRALELNEAVIDWFNPNNNYNEVVSLAADESGGQGFVTEFADMIDGTGMTGVQIQVWADWQEDTWAQFQATTHTDPVQMVQQATGNWSGLDGMDEAFAGAVTLPSTITLEDFQNCMVCYLNEPGVSFDTTEYLRQIYELVVKPMLDTQKLLDARPYMTRVYTTMSAEEMTMDPVFAFNRELADVSNVHRADRVVHCEGGLDPNADGTPWTVMLPQGDVVEGDQIGVWPVDIESQPAALKILQFTTQGQGEIIDDRSEMIADALGGLGSTPTPVGGTAGRGSDPTPSGSAGTMAGDPPGSDGPVMGGDTEAASGGDGACSATGRGAGGSLWLLALGALALLRRRRAA
jgi:uncharacterized protein (TIGR03382 family)